MTDSTAAGDKIPDDLVQVGHVTGAYGLRGGIRITPYSTEADALLNVKTWWLDKPALRPVRVRSAKNHSGDVTAVLVEVADRCSPGRWPASRCLIYKPAKVLLV